MSCTVVAVPYALAWVVGFVVSAAAGPVALYVDTIANNQESSQNNIPQNTYEDVCEEFHTITKADLMEKSLETPFVDKEILLKTLEEHGVMNIKEEYGKITGEVDTYSLSFEKMEADKPYFLTISYLAQNNPEEKLNDLSSEYALNVQEESYLSIIEKLKENNMQVEEEEVLDDNTIVLTVNLEN